MNKIAVIGAGATGHALAAILASKGHAVYLADTEKYEEVLRKTKDKGEIEVHGTVEVTGRPVKVSTDIENAVKEAELIVCCSVSGRDEELGQLICKYIDDTKAILISAGNGASIIYHKIFSECGHEKTLVGEVAGNLFPCRLTEDGNVRIGLPTSAKGAIAFPTERTKELVERFKGVWELNPCDSLLTAVFNGPNIICHGAGVVLNIAAIEKRGKEFNLFKDGLSPAVINLTDTLWEEKKKVYDAIGVEIPDPPRKMLEGVLDVEDKDYDSFREMDGPDSLNHRYISEDVPYLICFFVSIARAMDVEIPTFEGIVRIVEKVTEKDYYAMGRTLENLGMSSMSKSELVQFFGKTE